ncbi:MAG: helix-turn-helix domain-containing protein [Candidatus Poribacteria bacterium]
MEDKNIELISTKKTAEMLEVSVQTICKMIKDGRLRATKLRNAKSPWRINKESVMKYLKQATLVEGEA